ncbi:Ferritin-like domain protein [uncultured archaeon]|nr:Ferritin-like domain protein [uncultured archaeon]
MEIKKKMQDAINTQINKEFYSAYLYLSMASYFDNMNLKGFSHWMKKQAHEELTHGMKFYEHVTDRGGVVVLKPIAQPPVSWKSPEAAFEEVLAHERKVTESINQLYALSKSSSDTAAEVALHWFITEQIEEEAHTSEILAKIKALAKSPSGLHIIDKELKKRE